MNAAPIDTRTPENVGLSHVALLYRDDDRLREIVGEFVRAGAAAGEPVLALMPAEQLALLEDVFTVPGARVRRVDVSEAGRNPARLIPIQHDWIARHAGRTRIVTEALWPGRSAPEAIECLRLDALVNHALAGAPVDVLCSFDAAHLDADLLAGAELTHPRVIDDAGMRASASFGDPLELARGGRWPQRQPGPPIREVHFDGDLRTLRHALTDEALLDDLAAERREDFVFAVNEAATNAIRHGDGRAQVRLWRDGHHVVGEVLTPTTIDDPLVGLVRPGAEATRGRGLWLINQVCDLVEVRSDAGEASVRMHVAAA